MIKATMNSKRAPRGKLLGMLALFFSAMIVLSGCASAGAADPASTSVIEFDLDQFRAHVDEVLKTGMTLGEARKVVEKGFPKANMAITMAPVMQSGKSQLEGKRFMFGWHTSTPQKNITLTLFIDNDGKLVRWTVGAVYGSL